MARKVINTTHAANRYDILSQTPINYNPDNWFLRELQDKVNADWPYRPNRVEIEFEDVWGEQSYSPLEVVIQSVKSEAGTQISDDYKKLVFRDIAEKRFTVGSRFRFGDFYGQQSIADVAPEDKNIWLTINHNTTNMTAAVVIERCNGLLGSLVTDPVTGISVRHYEPVVLPQTLNGAAFLYNQDVVQERAGIMALVQTNEYTRQYFVNQRFILGYTDNRHQVYRIKSIHDFYSNTTNLDDQNLKSQGLTRLYLEVAESSPDDDFIHRIAAQSLGSPVVVQTADVTYKLSFQSPEPVPNYLGADPVTFVPVLETDSGEIIQADFTLSLALENLPSSVDVSAYVTVEQDGTNFILTRKRVYLGGDLELTWCIEAAKSPTGEDLVYSIQLGMGQYS